MGLELKDYVEFLLIGGGMVASFVTLKVTQSNHADKLEAIEKELNYLDDERNKNEKDLVRLQSKYENLQETSKDSISKLDDSVKELEKWVEGRLNNLEKKIENNHRDILIKFEEIFKMLK